jgi:hypothetical protein
MFRVSQGDSLKDVETVQEIEPAISAAKHGSFDIAEISSTPLPSAHTARCSGIVIKKLRWLSPVGAGSVVEIRRA